MNIKNLYLGILFFFSSSSFSAVVLTGVGATFPYPIYVKWSQAYQKQSDVQLNYQPIGSGGGIKQIQAKTVDFAASDRPLTKEELGASHLRQFPTVVGGIVPVINLSGVSPGQLKLSGPVLAEIFLGKIKKWNDPAITALNPGISLPNKMIVVVHRSDGSGTTFLFTNYLGQVSPEWKQRVGSDTAVAWPTGIGGKGNEGVASYTQRVNGSMGYVEYTYAEQNKLNHVRLINKSGNTVSPSLETFQAAVSNTTWNPQVHFAQVITNAEGVNSWPIVGATFVLMQEKQDDPARAQEVLNFFSWAFAHGGGMARELDYVPLSGQEIQLVEEYWKQNIKDQTGRGIWSGPNGK